MFVDLHKLGSYRKYIQRLKKECQEFGLRSTMRMMLKKMQAGVLELVG